MLKGQVIYKVDENTEYLYNVTGFDAATLSLNMIGIKARARRFMCSMNMDSNDFFDGEDDEQRRVDIKLTKVAVQTGKHNENGKMVKNMVNDVLFCQMAAVIRYVKNHCIKKNEKYYTGITLASKEFEAVTDTEYIIPFPNRENETLATVLLHLGCIYELHIDSPTLKIDLKNDSTIEDFLPKLTDAWQAGIKFDKDYLGFEPERFETVENIETINGMYTCIEDVIKAHPDKEFSWLLGKDYRIVDDEHLDEICKYIMDWDGYVYYDTETTGLNINFKSRVGQADQLVGIVLSVKYGESFFFPTQMKSIKNLCNGDHWYFMEHYMRPILEGKQLVAHNMTYDWKVAYIYDINANIVHDTMALIKLTIGAEVKDYPMGLKENAKTLLGRDSLELSDLLKDDEWGESDIKFWDLPYELVRLYACADTDNTNGLLQYALQSDLLTKYNAKKVYEIEIAFSFAVSYQEFFGHRIDVSNLAVVRKAIGEEQEAYMQKMVDIVGHEFNPNSSPQLQKILYQELGVPEQISRKTGRPTTDKETLKKLAEITDENDEPKYPFCGILQKYREAEGVRKIVDKFPEHVTPDGYVFSHVMQYGTTTGRVSINTPNYQSYNDPIKKNVVPRPGFWMFDTDYSSVEYRVLGNMVGNKRIMESFKDPDFDYHQYQAARMYGVPYATVTKKMRKSAKGINFGLPYGMGDESLGIRIFGEATPENTKKAAALRAAYFKGQEDIRDWFEYHRNKGVNEGFTETYFGRRRYYHKGEFSVGAIRRQAGNQVIQGCEIFNTLVQTKELGIVRVGNIVNQNLHFWDGNNWTTGFVAYSGKKKLCRVHFKGGMVFECSPTHKFLVRSHRGQDRFVECKDLIGLKYFDEDNNLVIKTNRNCHRVVVNPNYVPSDFRYNSQQYRGMFDCDTHNAHNCYIGDMQTDSFGKGVVLGRWASDGSYVYKPTTHSLRITHIIAEHEASITPILETYMQGLPSITRERAVRPNKNQKITNIDVYSTSLNSELNALDIKHKVHDNIFMDTEMLRGFLCGFFDGDGGITGKTISLRFGTQFEFEPMIKDMQKALLFFGIRSRYRRYKDSYTLQITTTDNERFLSLIGFINTEKQEKGKKLECKEDEHIFGKCLLVDYVEFTDELVDMYDVCNTERGYYVADGIITHNSAADIYKTAVGRVFKRICKEGWLGKVLFTGFIHDELLGEVSNEINPGIFLKILREEFEVKITNDDGTPWCPLYMGFGYGMSWYEAKSVELPIKLQWEIVEKYGETGFPYWTGNGRAFCDTVPDMLRDFSVRDIRNQLLDENSQGKEIKPTLNNELIDCVKEDAKGYTEGLKACLVNIDTTNQEQVNATLTVNEASIVDYLDKVYHIQSLMRDNDGNYVLEYEPSKKTQECIDLFCKVHATDRSKVNLLDIAEATATVNTDDVVIEQGDESTTQTEIMLAKIALLGQYCNVEQGLCYVKYLRNPIAWGQVCQYFTPNKIDGIKMYQMVMVELDYNNRMTPANWFIKSSDIPNLVNLYLQYANKGIN